DRIAHDRFQITDRESRFPRTQRVPDLIDNFFRSRSDRANQRDLPRIFALPRELNEVFSITAICTFAELLDDSGVEMYRCIAVERDRLRIVGDRGEELRVRLGVVRHRTDT